MAKVKLSAPWDEYYEQVMALFGGDPEVHIIFDEEEKDLKLYVETTTKAEALQHLFPAEKEWGGVKMTITIIPPNYDKSAFKVVKNGDMSSTEIINYAFVKNPHFKEVIHVDLPFWGGFVYVMFKNEVLQYYADNIGDPNGVKSVLAQDIAKEIFEAIDGVYYCTSPKKDCWTPLPAGTITTSPLF